VFLQLYSVNSHFDVHSRTNTPDHSRHEECGRITRNCDQNTAWETIDAVAADGSDRSAVSGFSIRVVALPSPSGAKRQAIRTESPVRHRGRSLDY
jgi:hypothetical protein